MCLLHVMCNESWLAFLLAVTRDPCLATEVQHNHFSVRPNPGQSVSRGERCTVSLGSSLSRDHLRQKLLFRGESQRHFTEVYRISQAGYRPHYSRQFISPSKAKVKEAYS